MKKGDNVITIESGQQCLKHTIVGWELLVEWRDGSSGWIPLKDVKEFNPIEVAEYAINNEIHDE